MTDSSIDKRYRSQIKLPQIGVEGQHKMHSAKVLVLGAGGLGCAVLTNLSYMGIGCLGIMDDDQVGAENLSRQILFDQQDIGKSKVDAAAAKLNRINAEVELKLYNQRLNSSNASETIEPFDLVVDCSDNFSARYALDDACQNKGIPLVYGGVRAFEGQVSVFNHRAGISFSHAFPDRNKALASENCEDSGVLVTLVNTIGAIQANEVVKIVLGLPSKLDGAMYYLDMLNHESRLIAWK